jgi:hypothetical protein
MLAGLQAMSFIPGTNLERFVPGVGPSYDDIVSGRDMVRYDKVPVRISEFHAEVFDMMDAGDRDGYEKRMKELVEGIQTSSCVIWKNDLQVISRNDGQHWMRYLEWARYDLNDRSSTASAPVNADKVAPKGVLQEVGGTENGD